MKKRWRYETAVEFGATGVNAVATFGPWKTAVEIHQVCCTVSTDATPANRIVVLQHIKTAPAFIIGQFPVSAAIPAAIDASTITWGQGLENIALTEGSTMYITAAIPFAMLVNIAETITVSIAGTQTGDQLAGVIIMVRDLDEPHMDQ